MKVMNAVLENLKDILKEPGKSENEKSYIENVLDNLEPPHFELDAVLAWVYVMEAIEEKHFPGSQRIQESWTKTIFPLLTKVALVFWSDQVDQKEDVTPGELAAFLCCLDDSLAKVPMRSHSQGYHVTFLLLDQNREITQPSDTH